MSDTTLFDLEPEVAEWHPIVRPLALSIVSLLTPPRCRDCGRSKFPHEHFCQGSLAGGVMFELCDDCAALDDVRGDVSHWGVRTTEIQRADLELARNRYRAAWQRGQALASADSALSPLNKKRETA